MNKKVKLLNVLMIIISIFLCTTCLAFSGEVETESGDVNYIDTYEEYEDLLVDTSTGYSQDELKYGYEEYQKEIKGYYEGYQREKTVRARVEAVADVEEYYELNEMYYAFSKYELQPISVRVLEGEYKDEVFSFEYLLTGDSLNNIKYSELQKGDIVFVSINIDEETGEPYADIINAGSNVERFGVLVCVGIIALLLLTLYGGKKGLITGLMTLLILDFCLIIIPNMGFMGAGFTIGGIALMILLVVLISLIELGINSKALLAMGISSIISIVTVFVLMMVNYLTRTVGVTFEAAAVSENVILGNMNFESLFIVTTMIIATFAITNITCKVISKLSKSPVSDFNEGIEACKGILGANVLYVAITLLTLYIPNHLLLLTNKYSSQEILNSEILVSELIRLFVIMISMSLTVPTVVFFSDKEKK